MKTLDEMNLQKLVAQIYSLCKEMLDIYGDEDTELDEMDGVNDVIDEAANFVNAFQNSILSDEVRDIRMTAYEKYQHDWMISHGIGEKELDKAVQEYADDQKDGYEGSVSDWLFDNGFGGSIWACYAEFLGAEYQDDEYMRYLLTEDEYILYQADIKNN